MLEYFKTGLFIPLGVYIFYTDIKKQIIKDKCILLGLTAAAAFAIIESLTAASVQPFINSLVGFILGGLPILLIILATKGAMGAGDMKLCALIGAYFGAAASLMSFLLGVILCGVFALIMLAVKKMNLKSRLAFAPFILIALALVMIFKDSINQFTLYMYGLSFL